jgi:hypothetical protein
MRKLWVGVAVVFALVGAVAAYREWVLIPPVREQVLKQLNDPESAQFRNTRYFGDWLPTHGAMCGEVNARNRKGGYVGFRRFAANVSFAEIESPRGFSRAEECEAMTMAPWWWLSR